MYLNRATIKRQGLWVFILMVILGFGIFWEAALREAPKRALSNAYIGRLPKPTEPTLLTPLQELIAPENDFKAMEIAHIPAINMNQRMPHPFVGTCINCHLIEGGAKAGSQFKTPVGAILEQLSSKVGKLGPAIIPQSERPHPPAGRCIKCHNLLVQVPVEKNDFLWQ